MHSAIHWGAAFENILHIGILDNVVTTRRPQGNYERAYSVGGAEDAWLVAFDYELAGDLRWIPKGASVTNPDDATGWAEPTGVLAFVDWARGGTNTFRFVPDADNPNFYVASYLVDPFEHPAPTLEPVDQSLKLGIRIRNATVDYGEVWRGVMFEYLPGKSLTDPVTATFSRGSAAHSLASRRTQPKLKNQSTLRDAHFEGTLRTTLIEGTRTNEYSNPRAFDNAAWVKTNCTISVNAGAGPDGLVTADHFVESTDGSDLAHGIAQTLPALTNGATQAVSFVVRAGTRSWCLIQARTKANNFPTASFDLVNGVLGTVTGGGSPVAHIEGPWWQDVTTTGPVAYYRCTLLWNAESGGTTPAVSFYSAIANDDPTYTGNGSHSLGLFHAQFEKDVAYETSIIPSSPRSGDVLNWPYAFRPQAMFVYYKGVWKAGAADYVRLMNIGQFSGAGHARVTIYGSAGGFVSFALTLNQNGVNVSVSASVTMPAFGDVIELLGYIQPDGKVQIIKSTNGGAEVAGTLSGAIGQPFPSTFLRPTLDVGGEGGSPLDTAVACAHLKAGPYVYAGRTMNTIAKARVA
jgi:hypothetical protein